MPEIIFKGPVPNHWNGRSGERITAIICHIMQGSMESTDGWFHNPQADASSNYGVAKDGRIWQWVADEDAAWANGIVQKPDLSIPWLAECVVKNINPNDRTISIEHEGYSGQPMPEAQYQATLWLQKQLVAKYNIPVDHEHITGHFSIDNVDRHYCPGPTFPWQRLMADLGSPPPPPAEDPNSHYFPETNKYVTNYLKLPYPQADGSVQWLDTHVGFWNQWKLNPDALKLWGYPQTGAYWDEGSGKAVQYFQRARFEFDRASQQFFLGLLGQEIVHGEVQPPPPQG